MKTRSLTILFIVSLCFLLTTTASAWRDTRMGDRNFERAWSAYMFKRTDAAKQYFTKAANSYAEGLAQNPPPRSALFVSTLVKSGMSFYFADQFEQCVKTMGMAMEKDKRIWETYLFSALAQAALGNKDQTIAMLKQYQRVEPYQPRISNALGKQFSDLEAGSVSLEEARQIIEAATQDQFINNMTVTGQGAATGKEQCNGNYWWRNNKAPCERRFYIDN